MARKWTDEEIEYLEMKWGNVSIDSICKKLKRTKSSVKTKVHRLKLGAFTDNGNYITFYCLTEMLGYKDGYSRKRLLNDKLPVHYKRINKKIKVVYLNEFWKWAEENKYILDLSKLERGSLGEEPKWVEEKRKQDNQRKLKYITGKWSKKDDEYLMFLLKQHKYTYEEISEKINRKNENIRKRISELDIKERPVISEATRWTDEEITTLNQCVKNNMPYELITEVVNKNTKQIRTKLYKMYSTENLRKVNEILKKVG